MSYYGEWKTATIAVGANSSAAVDLGRRYDYLSVQIPAMDTCKLHLQVAELLDSTYYDLGKETTTNEEAFNRADTWRIGNWRYIKVVSSSPQTGERLIKVAGVSY